jgi:hypothetical protein
MANLDLDMTFDFGFTAVDADELDVLQNAKAELKTTAAVAQDTEEKLNKLYNMVMPLLNNLAANPDKDYIYWPNRLAKIDQFRDAIDKVYKS